MKKMIAGMALCMCQLAVVAQSASIDYVDEFQNSNHPQIGYWFISPNLLVNEKYLPNVDSIAKKCKYTMLFLTAREGANFYDFPLMRPIFSKLVAAAHKNGLKIGLQLWGNYKDKKLEGAQRLIIENEVSLDKAGAASLTVTAKYIRFEDRLLKSDLFKVYAFKKTGEGFYDPSTFTDITAKCETVLPDKKTVQVKIIAGESLAGMTACVMTQEYCSQSSNWDDVEINGFIEAMKVYSDIPFDGFSLDEYGNKFVERIMDKESPNPFRGRWYSRAMAAAYQQKTGQSLEKTLFDGRYAPKGKPEVRIKAINTYMEFMREGALRVEDAVNKASREIFGQQIFNGIHDTYHNSLVNDEIWANGIAWWRSPRLYGQTDEKLPTPTQMGVAMAHTKNAMYNQYYDAVLSPVVVKALHDLRYGIRTHYHALNDKRPLRFDLEFPEAIDTINRIENCARLLNRFNPKLPAIKLLVIFGMEGLSNWYPEYSLRGVYDINDKMGVEEKAVAIWKAGYLNAVVPSDLIVNKTLFINKQGKPEMNGHVFDAVLYLNPQYAREPVLQFLETYQQSGGKLMIEGKANRDFAGNLIEKRLQTLYQKATVNGFSIDKLPMLGIAKNYLEDGCKNEDGSYVFTDLPSLRSRIPAHFAIKEGDTYTGSYTGLAVILADKKNGLQKFAAAGCTELAKNGKVLFRFEKPVDLFLEKKGGKLTMTLADSSKKIKPLLYNL